VLNGDIFDVFTSKSVGSMEAFDVDRLVKTRNPAS
jgi:hypothetical protein